MLSHAYAHAHAHAHMHIHAHVHVHADVHVHVHVHAHVHVHVHVHLRVLKGICAGGCVTIHQRLQSCASEVASLCILGGRNCVHIEPATLCIKVLFVTAIGLASCSAAGFGCGAQDISTRFSSLIYGASSVFAVVAGTSSVLKAASWQRHSAAARPPRTDPPGAGLLYVLKRRARAAQTSMRGCRCATGQPLSFRGLTPQVRARSTSPACCSRPTGATSTRSFSSQAASKCSVCLPSAAGGPPSGNLTEALLAHESRAHRYPRPHTHRCACSNVV